MKKKKTMKKPNPLKVVPKYVKRRNKEEPLTHEHWLENLAFFDNRCVYCGEEGEMTKDHLLAESRGGQLTKYNILPACRRCNSSKSNNDLIIWYSKQPFFTYERLIKIIIFLKSGGKKVGR